MAFKVFVIISLTATLLAFGVSIRCERELEFWPPSPEVINLAFTNAKIVPHILEEAPNSILQVEYVGTVIRLGGIVNTPTYLETPTVQWPSKRGRLYTLLMLDPDASCPELPYGRYTLHWLVSNIQGNDLSGHGVKRNAKYIAPWSWPEYHRFLFLVYEQSRHVTYDDYETLESIQKFNLNVFIERHGLGSTPLFGNFYVSYNASAPFFEVNCNPAPPLPFLQSKVFILD